MGKNMETQKKIEDTVVTGYKKIEDGVVSGYKSVEDTFVSGYKKVEDKFVGAFFDKDPRPNGNTETESTSEME